MAKQTDLLQCEHLTCGPYINMIIIQTRLKKNDHYLLYIIIENKLLCISERTDTF